MKSSRKAYLKHRREWRNCLEDAQVCRVKARIWRRRGYVAAPAFLAWLAGCYEWIARRHRVLMKEYKPKKG